MNSPLAQLAANGVSIWLDDLSRSRIRSGALEALIGSRSVSGVTTNPTIFAGALAKGEGYGEQVTELAAAGKSASEAVFEITTQDVAEACDIFKGVYASSHGFDGRVSMDFAPGATLLGTCVSCGEKSNRMVNCSDLSCREQMVQCDGCAGTTVHCAEHAALTAAN